MNSCCRNSMFNGNSNNNVLGTSNCSNNTSPSNICCNNTNVLSSSDHCTNENLLDSLCCCVGRRCSCEFEIDDGGLEKRERNT